MTVFTFPRLSRLVRKSVARRRREGVAVGFLAEQYGIRPRLAQAA